MKIDFYVERRGTMLYSEGNKSEFIGIFENVEQAQKYVDVINEIVKNGGYIIIPDDIAVSGQKWGKTN